MLPRTKHSHQVMALVAALAAGSCNRSMIVADITEDCASIDCSGHGTCVIAPAGPMCMCDPGFRREGTGCVTDTAVASCAGVDCSGHGTCAIVGGTTTVCLCDDGYEHQGTACVTGAGSEALLTLEAEWVTPHAIMWRWDTAALGAKAHGYVLWYGEDPLEVARRTDLAAAWDVNDDPNLGWGISPFGPNEVRRTTVSDLVPDTTYYAQLWARRRDGLSLRVAEGSATTPAIGPSKIEIFAESMPPGSRSGFEDTLATEAHSGTGSLWYVGSGTWINASLRDVNVDVSDLATASWEHTYLELFVRIQRRHDKAAPIHYAELYLTPFGEDAFEFSGHHYLTLPNRTTWQRVQVPLATLERSGLPMTAAGLGDVLESMAIGFRTPEHRNIYVDDISIRY